MKDAVWFSHPGTFSRGSGTGARLVYPPQNPATADQKTNGVYVHHQPSLATSLHSRHVKHLFLPRPLPSLEGKISAPLQPQSSLDTPQKSRSFSDSNDGRPPLSCQSPCRCSASCPSYPYGSPSSPLSPSSSVSFHSSPAHPPCHHRNLSFYDQRSYPPLPAQCTGQEPASPFTPSFPSPSSPCPPPSNSPCSPSSLVRPLRKEPSPLSSPQSPPFLYHSRPLPSSLHVPQASPGAVTTSSFSQTSPPSSFPPLSFQSEATAPVGLLPPSSQPSRDSFHNFHPSLRYRSQPAAEEREAFLTSSSSLHDPTEVVQDKSLQRRDGDDSSSSTSGSQYPYERHAHHGVVTSPGGVRTPQHQGQGEKQRLPFHTREERQSPCFLLSPSPSVSSSLGSEALFYATKNGTETSFCPLHRHRAPELRPPPYESGLNTLRFGEGGEGEFGTRANHPHHPGASAHTSRVHRAGDFPPRLCYAGQKKTSAPGGGAGGQSLIYRWIPKSITSIFEDTREGATRGGTRKKEEEQEREEPDHRDSPASQQVNAVPLEVDNLLFPDTQKEKKNLHDQLSSSSFSPSSLAYQGFTRMPPKSRGAPLLSTSQESAQSVASSASVSSSFSPTSREGEDFPHTTLRDDCGRLILPERVPLLPHPPSEEDAKYQRELLYRYWPYHGVRPSILPSNCPPPPPHHRYPQQALSRYQEYQESQKRSQGIGEEQETLRRPRRGRSQSTEDSSFYGDSFHLEVESVHSEDRQEEEAALLEGEEEEGRRAREENSYGTSSLDAENFYPHGGGGHKEERRAIRGAERDVGEVEKRSVNLSVGMKVSSSEKWPERLRDDPSDARVLSGLPGVSSFSASSSSKRESPRIERLEQSTYSTSCSFPHLSSYNVQPRQHQRPSTPKFAEGGDSEKGSSVSTRQTEEEEDEEEEEEGDRRGKDLTAADNHHSNNKGSDRLDTLVSRCHLPSPHLPSYSRPSHRLSSMCRLRSKDNRHIQLETFGMIPVTSVAMSPSSFPPPPPPSTPPPPLLPFPVSSSGGSPKSADQANRDRLLASPPPHPPPSFHPPALEIDAGARPPRLQEIRAQERIDDATAFPSCFSFNPSVTAGREGGRRDRLRPSPGDAEGDQGAGHFVTRETDYRRPLGEKEKTHLLCIPGINAGTTSSAFCSSSSSSSSSSASPSYCLEHSGTGAFVEDAALTLRGFSHDENNTPGGLLHLPLGQFRCPALSCYPHERKKETCSALPAGTGDTCHPREEPRQRHHPREGSECVWMSDPGGTDLKAFDEGRGDEGGAEEEREKDCSVHHSAQKSEEKSPSPSSFPPHGARRGERVVESEGARRNPSSTEERRGREEQHAGHDGRPVVLVDGQDRPSSEASKTSDGPEEREDAASLASEHLRGMMKNERRYQREVQGEEEDKTKERGSVLSFPPSSSLSASSKAAALRELDLLLLRNRQVQRILEDIKQDVEAARPACDLEKKTPPTRSRGGVQVKKNASSSSSRVGSRPNNREKPGDEEEEEENDVQATVLAVEGSSVTERHPPDHGHEHPICCRTMQAPAVGRQQEKKEGHGGGGGGEEEERREEDWETRFERKLLDAGGFSLCHQCQGLKRSGVIEEEEEARKKVSGLTSHGHRQHQQGKSSARQTSTRDDGLHDEGEDERRNDVLKEPSHFYQPPPLLHHDAGRSTRSCCRPEPQKSGTSLDFGKTPSDVDVRQVDRETVEVDEGGSCPGLERDTSCETKEEEDCASSLSKGQSKQYQTYQSTRLQRGRLSYEDAKD